MGICHLVRNTKMGTCHPFGPTWKMGMLNIWTKLRLFFKNGNLRFLTHSKDLGAKLSGKWSYGRPASFLFPKKQPKNTIWTLFSRVRFLVRCSPNKEGPGAQGPGAHMGPGPYGPWPLWALGPGPYGPWRIWAMFQICIFKPSFIYFIFKPDFYI